VSARWSSRSLGSRLQHGIFYALIRCGGVFAGYGLLFFVVSWYTLRPSVRGRSAAYIRRRFPGAGPWRRFVHAWKLQWRFGQCLVDRAAAGILGDFVFERSFPETLAAVVAEGKGAILLSAHTGCWQMAPYALARHAARSVTVLAHKERGDYDKQAHEHAGGEAPFQVVVAGEGMATPVALLRVLRQGGLLCLMGDRLEGERQALCRVRFLGDALALPAMPFRLASATGAPLVCVFALRTGPRRGRLHVAAIIRVPEGLGRDGAQYAPYAQRFATALEDFVREHPCQFFNFYDLWGQ
jgi:predicted LPLAT superfamily acyltransferase